MQTRDYDDYIFVDFSLGFRKVDAAGLEIEINKDTDGYCNLYANNISVSYLHSMDDCQINAIHFFEENHKEIFKIIIKFLSKKYKNPKQILGFRHVNVLNKNKHETCYTEYLFIDALKNKIKVTMHKFNLIN